jgi:tripartite-type tricarboxylate transporter receptor subunit TctC
VVKSINAAVNEVLRSPEAAHYFGTKGYEIAGGTPQAFAGFLAAESEKWGRAARLAGLLK